MHAPKVSLGFPVYNGEKYLRLALDSLVQQDYDDFELVISDNASSDETGAICRHYAQKDSRIRYSRNDQNIGLAANHGRVLELSRGEFFKWVAHDDEYSRHMLSRLVEVFSRAPLSVSVVYSQCEIIDENGNSLGISSDPVEKRHHWPFRRVAHLLLKASIYNFTYGLIRTDMLRRTRGYGCYPLADRVLFAELAMLGEFWEVAEPLLRLRFHPGRTFHANTTREALQKLFNPSCRGKSSFLSMEARAQFELVRSAVQTPPHLQDKFSCALSAMFVPYWVRFKNFGGLQRRKLLRMFSRTAKRASLTGSEPSKGI